MVDVDVLVLGGGVQATYTMRTQERPYADQ
jgi:hypothetical protein